MKATELRVGNYLEYKKMVIRFELDDFCEASNNSQFLELLIKPIPLTEQWLKDLGLERAPQPNGIIFYGNRSVFCRITGHPYEDTFLLFGYEFPVKIKYVHQFQNLYFALTETELTIKGKIWNM